MLKRYAKTSAYCCPSSDPGALDGMSWLILFSSAPALSGPDFTNGYKDGSAGPAAPPSALSPWHPAQFIA